MYTIEQTITEIQNEAISPDDVIRWANFHRDAFVWTVIAEKRGQEFEMNVVRFFERGEWIDTWYPVDRASAERLARDWICGSTEVTDRHAEVMA